MNPYAALQKYPQFIIWHLTEDGRKIPCGPDGRATNAHDPSIWVDFETAQALAEYHGATYGVGFVFTDNDPFWFVDIDKCLEDGKWSDLAVSLMNRLRGALVEVSQSGKGLHIIGSGVVPPHASKNTSLKLECYHTDRFVALGNMATAVGDSECDLSAEMARVIADYFPTGVGQGAVTGWTDAPVPEWNGPEDDAELIDRMLKAKSAASAFGLGASVRDLWEANGDVLAAVFPANNEAHAWDGSSADAALAQHLAFWTGKDCDRMLRLMGMSALVRDKWQREDYLYRTILNAVSRQVAVYSRPETGNIEQYGPAVLKGSEAQVKFADSIRAEKVLNCADPEVAIALCQVKSASFWIDHREKTVEQLYALLNPEVNPIKGTLRLEISYRSGMQYVSADQQVELFAGCVYVRGAKKVFMPDGEMIDPSDFSAWFGGYLYQMDDVEKKVTKDAFEAFTKSQMVDYPMAVGTCFRPELPPGQIVVLEGRPLVNTYIPVETRRLKGDVSPFLRHVELLLPDKRDQMILLSYMAAVVQYKGVKFQWAPLIQGAQGNGKTLFTRCVAFAIGDKYTHLPSASEIAEKFNAWLFDTLFIGVEDVFVPAHKKEVMEVLKPMITSSRYAKRAMHSNQVTADMRCNFMLNTNHKDAIQKTKDDRRFAVFYTKQQSAEDILADGMDAEYFSNLYGWLNGDGYAIVNEFLHTYNIPEQFNPATGCLRAPFTSSSGEAIEASRSGVEHALLEVIAEGRPGMMGGWVSSIALDSWLKETHYARYVPVNRRKEMMESLGYVLHPALPDGRVNSPSGRDGGKKPRLYCMVGSEFMNLTDPKKVLEAYTSSQLDIDVN